MTFIVLSATGVAAQKPKAELPVYELGDRWFRNDGVFELTRIESDRYVFVADGGREVHLTKALGLAKTVAPHNWVEMSPPMELAWPLEVGKWGVVHTSRWRHSGNTSGVDVRLSWQVKAYEDVRSTTSAAMKAFRVEFEVRAPGWTRSWTWWYAPEAQQWVRGQAPPNTMPLVGYRVFDIPPATALAVRVDEPADQARVPSTTPLTGEVKSRKGVTSVTVTVNGVEILARRPADGPRVVPLNQPLVLKDGKNTVLVTVTDRTGERHQEARTIFADKTLVAAGPAPAPLVAEPPGVAPGASSAATPGLVTEPPDTPAAPALTPPPAVASTVTAPRPPAAPVSGATSAAAPSAAAPTVAPAAPAPGAGPAAPPAVPPSSAPAPPAKPAPQHVAALPPPPPLVVRLSSPSDKAKVEHETVALAGVASGGKGISRVVVTVNGVEVHKRDEPSPARAIPLNLPLKLREGANTLVVTVIDADGALEQETRAVSYERPLPFGINVRFPEDRARVTEEASLVAAIAESSRGITQARILLNGTEVHQQTERLPQRSLLVTAPVTLREGANLIVVAATQADGTVRQEVRTVTFDRPKVAAVPPPPPKPALPAQERWAVVIGVGAYDSHAVPRLRFSVADAEAIYQTLIGPAGFKKENVLLLTDRSERKPTLRNIKWALGTFLGRSAKKDDTVLIFFAGHGAPEVDTRGIERDGLAKYLIPSDADPDDLYSTALPMDELQTIFGRIESERIVAFLDACYSGAAGGRTFTARQTRASNLDDLFLERLTRSKGRAIVTASRPSEVSLELPELGHGIFTYYLVNGLKGRGDLNRDGIVSLQELYEYVEQQVSTKSRASGGNQHPVMKGEMEGILPLTKVGN